MHNTVILAVLFLVLGCQSSSGGSDTKGGREVGGIPHPTLCNVSGKVLAYSCSDTISCIGNPISTAIAVERLRGTDPAFEFVGLVTSAADGTFTITLPGSGLYQFVEPSRVPGQSTQRQDWVLASQATSYQINCPNGQSNLDLDLVKANATTQPVMDVPRAISDKKAQDLFNFLASTPGISNTDLGTNATKQADVTCNVSSTTTVGSSSSSKVICEITTTHQPLPDDLKATILQLLPTSWVRQSSGGLVMKLTGGFRCIESTLSLLPHGNSEPSKKYMCQGLKL